MNIDDDTLTLFFYDDGLSARERSTVEAALRNDPLLAARFARLQDDLRQLGEAADVELPADLLQRLHDRVDSLAGVPDAADKHQGFHPGSFFWGAALTAALVLGVFVGNLMNGTPPAVVETYTADISDPYVRTGSPFVRGLQVHLQNSERGLNGLPAGDADRNLLLMNILDQNRLFERAATENDAPDLARVLRAFELILVRLAAEDIAPEDADALRNKLLFELNVVLTKLSRESSIESQTI